MRNEKIRFESATPLLSAASGQNRLSDDVFAMARRLHTPIWVYDIDNCRIAHANAAACDLWQAPDEETLGKRDLAKDMSPTVANRLRQYQSDFVDRDAKFNEMWTLYPKGEPKSVMVFLRGFWLPDGRVAMQCEASEDIDDQPENLRSVEALLHTDVMITLYERDGPPLYMNPAARSTAADALQKFADIFVDPADHDRLAHTLDAYGEHRLVARVKTNQGQRWYDMSAKLCLDSVTGKPAKLVTAIDVSELKTARDKARYLADRDVLTGSYNRTYLLQHMTMLERRKKARCALLCFDVDHFKQINDRYGHEMGDVVLKEIANRARQAIRQKDTLVRLGGDEFVVLFEDAPPEHELSAIVDRLLVEVSKPITHDAKRVNITVSIGVAEFLQEFQNFAEVMHEADIALYASKQAGRNRVTHFCAQMGDAARARQQTELEISTAMKRREFFLHFQPRYNLQTGKVVAAEALVRWQHPEKGLVMPDEFIPICEETGMIEDLGQLVLEQACAQALNWRKAGLDIGLSVNISPRQFSDPRLMRSLETFSQNPDFPCRKIELEITENVLIGDLSKIESKLKSISQMGYRIAIDDFGTGYSNLSYISRFPLNCLKIDRSFVHQLPQTGPIVNLILTLADQIGATFVAEGVETVDQLKWLATNQCEQVQGYILSRPVAIEQLETIIDEVNSEHAKPCFG